MSSDIQQQLPILKQELQRTSDDAVLLNEVVAARFGIHPTDLKVLSLLSRKGPLSPGQIGQATGLTTGAVTFLLDRLEKTNYAHRVRHPTDRRMMQIELNRALIEERGYHQPFEHMDHALEQVLASYNEREFMLILDFISRMNDATEQVIAHISNEPHEPREHTS
jgi:DNA-binding MarR family transcriptional regulator